MAMSGWATSARAWTVITPIPTTSPNTRLIPKTPPACPTAILRVSSSPPPEFDRAVPDQDELPESLPGFDLAAGLSRLMAFKIFCLS
jgi:hypothetical protein